MIDCVMNRKKKRASISWTIMRRQQVLLSTYFLYFVTRGELLTHFVIICRLRAHKVKLVHQSPQRRSPTPGCVTHEFYYYVEYARMRSSSSILNFSPLCCLIKVEPYSRKGGPITTSNNACHILIMLFTFGLSGKKE